MYIYGLRPKGGVQSLSAENLQCRAHAMAYSLLDASTNSNTPLGSTASSPAEVFAAMDEVEGNPRGHRRHVENSY